MSGHHSHRDQTQKKFYRLLKIPHFRHFNKAYKIWEIIIKKFRIHFTSFEATSWVFICRTILVPIRLRGKGRRTLTIIERKIEAKLFLQDNCHYQSFKFKCKLSFDSDSCFTVNWVVKIKLTKVSYKALLFIGYRFRDFHFRENKRCPL